MSNDRNQNRMYAVAVRDGHELFLFCRIRRTVTGDVYVLPPRPDPDWNPHVSYHASGQYHVKGVWPPIPCLSLAEARHELPGHAPYEHDGDCLK